jgi:hypothetical protein
MPLFGRNSTETSPADPEAKSVDNTQRRGNLFRRHRSSSPTATTTTAPNVNSHHRLLHRNAEDPSIVAARERVLSAEAAERDADKALSHARGAVREARDHVKRLEREATEGSVTIPYLSLLCRCACYD